MPDSGEFLDPYLDPETGILRNLVSARTKESLDDAEASLSFARLVQLMDQPPKPQSTGELGVVWGARFVPSRVWSCKSCHAKEALPPLACNP
jgi:hypothetical protein